MSSQLFYIFFKTVRKIQSVYHGLYCRLKFAFLHHLSKQRFVFKSNIIIGKGFSIQSDISETNIIINEAVRFRDNFHVMMGNRGSLSIGSNCFFNNNCSLNCLGSIIIASDCQFGENVYLYDHNHCYKDKAKLVSAQGYDVGSIKIGNNCWIGSNVTILKDVEIGDNVVIGAGCVIFRSVESDSVVINQQNLLIKKNTE